MSLFVELKLLICCLGAGHRDNEGLPYEATKLRILTLNKVWLIQSITQVGVSSNCHISKVPGSQVDNLTRSYFNCKVNANLRFHLKVNVVNFETELVDSNLT